MSLRPKIQRLRQTKVGREGSLAELHIIWLNYTMIKPKDSTLSTILNLHLDFTESISVTWYFWFTLRRRLNAETLSFLCPRLISHLHLHIFCLIFNSSIMVNPSHICSLASPLRYSQPFIWGDSCSGFNMSNPGKMMRSLVGQTLISTRARNL